MVTIDMSLMLFTHYLFGYVGTFICSVGLILTLCSVYIFTRRQMRSAVSTYLTGLSVSDSCLLSLGLIFAINSSIPPNQQSESFYSSRLHKLLFPYIYACIIWFQFTSVWITIGFAIDRWFAIKWPMLHYTYSSKRACYIVVTIYCLGLIYSLPRFFEYKTEVTSEKLTEFENYTEYVDHLVIKNKLHNNTIYQYTVHLTLYSLFQSILPLLMLSYFNVELIRSINASSHFLERYASLYGQTTRIGGETSTTRCREGVITRSVVCLIGLFILCQVPASILHYIYMFYRNHKWLYICYDISNFLILLNSAVNFFIFTCFNRKFRRELANVFFRRTRRNDLLHAPSHQSLKRTSSHVRLPQQNQFDSLHSNYWAYQKRMNNGSIDQIGKKHSESEYGLNSVYRRSESLSNIYSPNTNQLKHDRYSVCEFNHKKSSFITNKERKSTNFIYQKNKPKTKDIYRRRNSGRYSLNLKNTSLSSNTSSNSGYSRGQQLHYVTYRRESYQHKLSGQSSSGTTTSNLTRSTINTGSESSVLMDQNKRVKTFSNDIKQPNYPYRK